MTNAWKVMLGDQEIDTVFYSSCVDKEQVRQGLINHDNYPGNIHLVLDDQMQSEAFNPHNTINS